jgi:hypothetical protein
VTPTVDDLRNDVRTAVGRHERVESTAFTKEALAAICEALEYDIGSGGLPPKARMRAGIRWRLGAAPDDSREHGERPLRKGELERLAEALQDS